MKHFTFTFLVLLSLAIVARSEKVPEHFKHVDQVIWVVNDLDKVVENWKKLGFQQIEMLGDVTAISKNDKQLNVRMAVANLGGAHITWIEPISGISVLSKFHDSYGDGAMSLVHKVLSKSRLQDEVDRLSKIGIEVLDELSFSTPGGKLNITLMDTQENGKYVLGYVTNETSADIHQGLTSENRHNLKLNQYAFAINNPKDISAFWAKIGFPEFQISHPELGETKYHGEIVDHALIQGWQRHGDIAYEWCIPVKGPIVYADHINMHGEGIHHLAFSVDNMDKVLQDYKLLGYKNTMGGTWGEKGKPGSGRYEYVGLEDAGGMTMELLWNYQEN
jgi:methylmalonyl-CoA/ethylmalonyl-CoA epimerase